MIFFLEAVNVRLKDLKTVTKTLIVLLDFTLVCVSSFYLVYSDASASTSEGCFLHHKRKKKEKNFILYRIKKGGDRRERVQVRGL
jgi:hypothetical protein